MYKYIYIYSLQDMAQLMEQQAKQACWCLISHIVHEQLYLIGWWDMLLIYVFLGIYVGDMIPHRSLAICFGTCAIFHTLGIKSQLIADWVFSEGLKPPTRQWLIDEDWFMIDQLIWLSMAINCHYIIIYCIVA